MKSPLIILTVSFSLLVALACVSLGVGAVTISLRDTVEGLSGTQRTILWQLRLPRIVTACLVGGALGTAGVGFQALFRNPLADPYVIGASSGAALGVTLSVVAGLQISFLGFGATALSALIGSVLIVMLVFAIGSIGGQTHALSLLLAGVAISSMINAFVSLLMFWNDDKVIVILAWLMGSLADNDWSVVITTAVLSVLGTTLLWSLSRPLDAFLLGDVASQSLGLDLLRFRMLLVTGSSIATAAAVAAAGIIGFVGLIAPHIARALVGTRHVWLIPMSGCVGAIIMLVSDNVARSVVAPAELPVGIVTALLGCPFFLFLLKSRSFSRSVPA